MPARGTDGPNSPPSLQNLCLSTSLHSAGIPVPTPLTLGNTPGNMQIYTCYCLKMYSWGMKPQVPTVCLGPGGPSNPSHRAQLLHPHPLWCAGWGICLFPCPGMVCSQTAYTPPPERCLESSPSPPQPCREGCTARTSWLCAGEEGGSAPVRLSVRNKLPMREGSAGCQGPAGLSLLPAKEQ